MYKGVNVKLFSFFAIIRKKKRLKQTQKLPFWKTPATLNIFVMLLFLYTLNALENAHNYYDRLTNIAR